MNDELWTIDIIIFCSNNFKLPSIKNDFSFNFVIFTCDFPPTPEDLKPIASVGSSAVIVSPFLLGGCDMLPVKHESIPFSGKMSHQECLAEAIRSVPQITLIKQSRQDESHGNCLTRTCPKALYYSDYKIESIPENFSTHVTVTEMRDGSYAVENTTLPSSRLSKFKDQLDGGMKAVSASIRTRCGEAIH